MRSIDPVAFVNHLRERREATIELRDGAAIEHKAVWQAIITVYGNVINAAILAADPASQAMLKGEDT